MLVEATSERKLDGKENAISMSAWNIPRGMVRDKALLLPVREVWVHIPATLTKFVFFLIPFTQVTDTLSLATTASLHFFTLIIH